MYQTWKKHPACILFRLSNHHLTSHLPLQYISKQHSVSMFLQLAGKTEKSLLATKVKWVRNDSVECVNISFQSQEKNKTKSM